MSTKNGHRNTPTKSNYDLLDPTLVSVCGWGKNQENSSSSEEDSDENSWDNVLVVSTLSKERQQHPLESKFYLKVAMMVHDAHMLNAYSNHCDSNTIKETAHLSQIHCS